MSPCSQTRVKRRSRRPPVPASWRIGTKPVPPLTNQWRTSLWGNTPTWLFPTISRSLSKRAPSSTRGQILRASQLQVKRLKWSFHKQTQFNGFLCLSSWADGLLPGQRPPHDTSHLSSHVGASRFRHQSGAANWETPDVLIHHLPVVVVLFLLSAFSQSRGSKQPVHLVPREPVPLLTSDQLWFLPNQQQLRLQLPASTQVSAKMWLIHLHFTFNLELLEQISLK